jgi:hypothetical protein
MKAVVGRGAWASASKIHLGTSQKVDVGPPARCLLENFRSFRRRKKNGLSKNCFPILHNGILKNSF